MRLKTRAIFVAIVRIALGLTCWGGRRGFATPVSPVTCSIIYFTQVEAGTSLSRSRLSGASRSRKLGSTNCVVQNFTMRLLVERFSHEHHLDDTVRVLLRVRAADPNYPSPVDASPNGSSFTEWLMSGKVIGRWVALLGGRVVGHVALTEPHDYLAQFLAGTAYAGLRSKDLCEVSKLFVDPDSQRSGVGGALLSHMFEVARSLDRVLALAVVSTSDSALRLYSQSALQDIGTFQGIHGTNHVFIDTKQAEPKLAADGAAKQEASR